MESTGIYWKPIFNILESQLEVMVVNAAHMKAIPAGCRWVEFSKASASGLTDHLWSVVELLWYKVPPPPIVPPTPPQKRGRPPKNKSFNC